MTHATLITGDVFDCLAATPDGSIDLVLTSPPFLALRSYLPADHPDKAKEIGQEPDPAAFVDTLLRLSAEFRRVLAPHGSIAVELGDTYAGGNGEGSDTRGKGHRPKSAKGGANGDLRPRTRGDWPEAKSACLIPELYRVGLAYGRNPLTGEPSPAGRWRVRNTVRWCRPNPPVGALGDKFRPATSDMVIACLDTPAGQRRYFDLDAVREANPRVNEAPRVGKNSAARAGQGGDWSRGPDSRQVQNPAGAPPLDWWEIPTQPYSGSHYAVWPPALLERPIKAMCPQRVCTTCGEPSRRIVESEGVGRSGRGLQTSRLLGGGRADGSAGWERVTTTTLGWTDCGHGSYRCRSCHVVVPSDYALRGPREGASSQEGVGTQAVLAEPIEGTVRSADDSGDLRAVRSGFPGSAGSAVLHAELFSEAGSRGGPSQHDPAEDAEPRQAQDVERLRPRLGSGGHAGSAQERADDGTSARDARAPRQGVGALGDRASSERGQGRQPGGEPGNRDQGEACGPGPVPALSGDVSGQLAAYTCPCCGGGEVEYVADHWRNGITLDPFAGSGTTLAAATGHGRDALGYDLDPRNVDLAIDRVGGLFLTTYTLDQWREQAA